MRNTLLMSVDLGTTFIKVGVYDAGSACVACAVSAVKSDTPSPGVFIQRGDDIFESVVECIKLSCGQLGERSGNVAAIAFTGQMAGFIGVDKNWNDITTWSCSLDSRYMPYAVRQLETLKDDFLKISGANDPQMAPKYEWFKTEFSEEAKKIAKYMSLSSYVLGRLGEVPIENAVIAKSYLQWTGLADVKNGAWSPKLCDAVKMDRSHLPNIVEANEICGRLSKTIAKSTGLTAGIPLVAGAGDKAAGCLGAGIVDPGQMIFEASSYGAITCCIDTFQMDTEKRRYDIVPSPIPGYFFAMHYIAGSGITLDWFIKTFGDGKTDIGKLFQDIDSKVEKIKPGCEGLMAIGLLGGSSQPLDGALRGMWMGFNWSHKKEHFYRALLESYSYDFTYTIERFEDIFREYTMDKIKVIGGGAKSRVWTQMNADVAGKTYQHLDRDDIALWGAAIMSGNAVGVFADMKETAISHVNIKQEFYPNMEQHRLYKPFLSLYKKYTVDMRGYFRQVQDLSTEN